MAGPHTCFGCCGRDYIKEELKQAIHKNTLEFKSAKDLVAFRERLPKDQLRACGVCANLIFSDETKSRTLCPLHPQQTPDGKDLREGHCDISFSCKAAFAYEGWDEKTRKKFLAFLREQNDDLINYSIKMDSDEYFEEFLKQA
ncbi:hypothetical protein D6774_01230 [Candidatus Woesearchaeota archaeon]|nr:MAG: hypothetical protein D6774_01230 [Candidatus Woesearchaeota archaeon]